MLCIVLLVLLFNVGPVIFVIVSRNYHNCVTKLSKLYLCHKTVNIFSQNCHKTVKIHKCILNVSQEISKCVTKLSKSKNVF